MAILTGQKSETLNSRCHRDRSIRFNPKSRSSATCSYAMIDFSNVDARNTKMDILLRFLIFGGKYLTRITAQSIIEAYNRSVTLGNRLQVYYAEAFSFTESYDNILDIFNHNLQDLSNNTHIHLAFISDQHKQEFDKYLRDIERNGGPILLDSTLQPLNSPCINDARRLSPLTSSIIEDQFKKMEKDFKETGFLEIKTNLNSMKKLSCTKIEIKDTKKSKSDSFVNKESTKELKHTFLEELTLLQEKELLERNERLKLYALKKIVSSRDVAKSISSITRLEMKNVDGKELFTHANKLSKGFKLNLVPHENGKQEEEEINAKLQCNNNESANIFPASPNQTPKSMGYNNLTEVSTDGDIIMENFKAFTHLEEHLDKLKLTKTINTPNKILANDIEEFEKIETKLTIKTFLNQFNNKRIKDQFFCQNQFKNKLIQSQLNETGNNVSEDLTDDTLASIQEKKERFGEYFSKYFTKVLIDKLMTSNRMEEIISLLEWDFANYFYFQIGNKRDTREKRMLLLDKIDSFCEKYRDDTVELFENYKNKSKICSNAKVCKFGLQNMQQHVVSLKKASIREHSNKPIHRDCPLPCIKNILNINALHNVKFGIVKEDINRISESNVLQNVSNFKRRMISMNPVLLKREEQDLMPLPFNSQIKVNKSEMLIREKILDVNKKAFEEFEYNMSVVKLIKKNSNIDLKRFKIPILQNIIKNKTLKPISLNNKQVASIKTKTSTASLSARKYTTNIERTTITKCPKMNDEFIEFDSYKNDTFKKGKKLLNRKKESNNVVNFKYGSCVSYLKLVPKYLEIFVNREKKHVDLSQCNLPSKSPIKESCTNNTNLILAPNKSLIKYVDSNYLKSEIDQLPPINVSCKNLFISEDPQLPYIPPVGNTALDMVHTSYSGMAAKELCLELDNPNAMSGFGMNSRPLPTRKSNEIIPRAELSQSLVRFNHRRADVVLYNVKSNDLVLLEPKRKSISSSNDGSRVKYHSQFCSPPNEKNRKNKLKRSKDANALITVLKKEHISNPLKNIICDKKSTEINHKSASRRVAENIKNEEGVVRKIQFKANFVFNKSSLQKRDIKMSKNDDLSVKIPKNSNVRINNGSKTDTLKDLQNDLANTTYITTEEELNLPANCAAQERKQLTRSDGESKQNKVIVSPQEHLKKDLIIKTQTNNSKNKQKGYENKTNNQIDNHANNNIKDILHLKEKFPQTFSKPEEAIVANKLLIYKKTLEDKLHATIKLELEQCSKEERETPEKKDPKLNMVSNSKVELKPVNVAMYKYMKANKCKTYFLQSDQRKLESFQERGISKQPTIPIMVSSDKIKIQCNHSEPRIEKVCKVQVSNSQKLLNKNVDGSKTCRRTKAVENVNDQVVFPLQRAAISKKVLRGKDELSFDKTNCSSNSKSQNDMLHCDRSDKTETSKIHINLKQVDDQYNERSDLGQSSDCPDNSRKFNKASPNENLKNHNYNVQTELQAGTLVTEVTIKEILPSEKILIKKQNPKLSVCDKTPFNYKYKQAVETHAKYKEEIINIIPNLSEKSKCVEISEDLPTMQSKSLAGELEVKHTSLVDIIDSQPRFQIKTLACEGERSKESQVVSKRFCLENNLSQNATSNKVDSMKFKSTTMNREKTLRDSSAITDKDKHIKCPQKCSFFVHNNTQESTLTSDELLNEFFERNISIDNYHDYNHSKSNTNLRIGVLNKKTEQKTQSDCNTLDDQCKVSNGFRNTTVSLPVNLDTLKNNERYNETVDKIHAKEQSKSELKHDETREKFRDNPLHSIMKRSDNDTDFEQDVFNDLSNYTTVTNKSMENAKIKEELSHNVLNSVNQNYESPPTSSAVHHNNIPIKTISMLGDNSVIFNIDKQVVIPSVSHNSIVEKLVSAKTQLMKKTVESNFSLQMNDRRLPSAYFSNKITNLILFNTEGNNNHSRSLLTTNHIMCNQKTTNFASEKIDETNINNSIKTVEDTKDIPVENKDINQSKNKVTVSKENCNTIDIKSHEIHKCDEFPEIINGLVSQDLQQDSFKISSQILEEQIQYTNSDSNKIDKKFENINENKNETHFQTKYEKLQYTKNKYENEKLHNSTFNTVQNKNAINYNTFTIKKEMGVEAINDIINAQPTNENKSDTQKPQTTKSRDKMNVNNLSNIRLKLPTENAQPANGKKSGSEKQHNDKSKAKIKLNNLNKVETNTSKRSCFHDSPSKINLTGEEIKSNASRTNNKAFNLKPFNRINEGLNKIKQSIDDKNKKDSLHTQPNHLVSSSHGNIPKDNRQDTLVIVPEGTDQIVEESSSAVALSKSVNIPKQPAKLNLGPKQKVHHNKDLNEDKPLIVSKQPRISQPNISEGVINRIQNDNNKIKTLDENISFDYLSCMECEIPLSIGKLEQHLITKSIVSPDKEKTAKIVQTVYPEDHAECENQVQSNLKPIKLDKNTSMNAERLEDEEVFIKISNENAYDYELMGQTTDSESVKKIVFKEINDLPKESLKLDPDKKPSVDSLEQMNSQMKIGFKGNDFNLTDILSKFIICQRSVTKEGEDIKLTFSAEADNATRLKDVLDHSGYGISKNNMIEELKPMKLDITSAEIQTDNLYIAQRLQMTEQEVVKGEIEDSVQSSSFGRKSIPSSINQHMVGSSKLLKSSVWKWGSLKAVEQREPHSSTARKDVYPIKVIAANEETQKQEKEKKKYRYETKEVKTIFGKPMTVTYLVEDDTK